MILVDGKNSKIDITSAHIESYNLWGSLELIRTCGVHGAKGIIVFDNKKGIYSCCISIEKKNKKTYLNENEKRQIKNFLVGK